MGALLSKIRGDIRQAMLDKDETKKNILRVIVGEVQRKLDAESDEDVIRAIRKVIEGNNESLKHLDNPVLKNENEILGAYLPKLATIEEIEALLSGSFIDLELKQSKSEGQATGIAMRALKAAGITVDGKDVKTVVQKIRG